MPGKGRAAEVDLVGEALGSCRRHAELAKQLQPLRDGEQRPKGDLREDVVKSPLDVRKKDRHRLASAGRTVQEQLDGHCRQIGAATGHGSELGSPGFGDECRDSRFPQASAVQLADRAAAEDPSGIAQAQWLLDLPGDRRHDSSPPGKGYSGGSCCLADLGDQLHVEAARRSDELHGHCIGAHSTAKLAGTKSILKGADPLELRDPDIHESDVLDGRGDLRPGKLVLEGPGVARELRGEEALPAGEQLFPPGNDSPVRRPLGRDRPEPSCGLAARKLPDQLPQRSLLSCEGLAGNVVGLAP